MDSNLRDRNLQKLTAESNSRFLRYLLKMTSTILGIRSQLCSSAMSVSSRYSKTWKMISHLRVDTVELSSSSALSRSTMSMKLMSLFAAALLEFSLAILTISLRMKPILMSKLHELSMSIAEAGRLFSSS